MPSLNQRLKTLLHYHPLAAVVVALATAGLVWIRIDFNPAAPLVCLGYLIGPLAMIWYPDVVAWMFRSRWREFDRPATPEVMVEVLGWVLLLLMAGEFVVRAWGG